MSSRRPPRPASRPGSTARGGAPERPGSSLRPGPSAETRRAAARSAEPVDTSAAKDPAPHAAEPEQRPGVVQATDRFRDLVRPRPWRRRRRAILGTIAGALAVALITVGVMLFAPFFQVERVDVAETGYVDQEQVRSAAATGLGSSILALPQGSIEQRIGEIPGVQEATVQRAWPDGMQVTVTERTPIAQVTRPDGATSVVDAEGVQLPAEAAEGATLVPLQVGEGSADPDGAVDAMLEVLGQMPQDLRASTTSVTATSRSDVALTVAPEDGDIAKTVVWGDARDGELKTQVVQTLLTQPGTVIDVSSPVAPVTR